MNSLPQEIINELLIAMDSYNAIAKILIDKLITENSTRKSTLHIFILRPKGIN